MKKRNHWLMALLVVVLAVIPAIILIIGAHDREQKEIERFEKTFNIDSLRLEYGDSVYCLCEDSLKTLEDSIHFYEDGY